MRALFFRKADSRAAPHNAERDFRRFLAKTPYSKPKTAIFLSMCLCTCTRAGAGTSAYGEVGVGMCIHMHLHSQGCACARSRPCVPVPARTCSRSPSHVCFKNRISTYSIHKVVNFLRKFSTYAHTEAHAEACLTS